MNRSDTFRTFYCLCHCHCTGRMVLPADDADDQNYDAATTAGHLGWHVQKNENMADRCPPCFTSCSTGLGAHPSDSSRRNAALADRMVGQWRKNRSLGPPKAVMEPDTGGRR